MEIKRKKYQGVLNILSFNRHFYIAGLLKLLVLIFTRFLFVWPEYLFPLVFTILMYGLLAPILVSAYVYDFSGFYNFEWFKKLGFVDSKEQVNLNIHSGFDETSFIIKSILSQSQLQVYDFYDPKEHTEPAIIRARKISQIFPGTQQIKTSSIPLNDKSVDNIFLIFAAHEIRNHKERIEFFKECKRVCKLNGNIILVEHLRDTANFAAFTIGFFHFFSKNTWTKTMKEAGIREIEELNFTPFIRIFKCR
ncbi:MAG: methyltransferase domain-containing protein [Flavobacterium sp.]